MKGSGEMIKGAQKRMIVVKTADSEIFEEAYFVLRKSNTGEGEDMVREANRIIEESGTRRKKSTSGRLLPVISVSCFLCGGLLGGLITGLIIFFA